MTLPLSLTLLLCAPLGLGVVEAKATEDGK